MANLDKDAAKKILSSRVIVSEVGRNYPVRVTNVTFFEGKHIANFNAMNPYQYNEVKALLKEGKWDEACNKTLSASLLDRMYIPTKGEIVNIVLDYVTTKSGEQALLVRSVNPLPTATAAKAVFDFDDEEEETEDVELDDLEEVEEEPLPPVIMKKTTPAPKTQPKRK